MIFWLHELMDNDIAAELQDQPWLTSSGLIESIAGGKLELEN